jgi:hypothetical protein
MGESGGGSSDVGPPSDPDDYASGRLTGSDAGVIAELVGLYRGHPRWAVWLPSGGRGWVAVRPAGSRQPGPEVAMVWVRAGTAAELTAQMDRADAELSSG